MSLPVGNWNYPTHTRFGAGRIRELPDACAALGIARPLLVTDPGLAALPLLAAARDSLAAAGRPASVFSALKPNPVGANVEAGVAQYRADGCDGVIAFGGGSALDVGKTVALMAGQRRPLWDFEDCGDNYLRADPAGIAAVVAVPTTAGTGSEMGRAAVIVNEAEQRKVIVFHPRMLPGEVIMDPELTVGLPSKLTAWTGLDALAHCLEAWCAPGFHPLADGIALEGMRLIHDSLPRAYADGADLRARGDMLAAAGMGATAFQKGLGAIHALSHPVGAHYDTHHGLTNAVFMPYVLVFNRPAIETRLEAAARYLGLPQPGFDGFLQWVMALREQLDIPHTLAELGVDAAAAGRIAAEAEQDPSAAGNPVPVKAPELERIFLAAVAGRLDA
ncbi:iron-containing alcohol dehydrogenase [Acidihalobacter ferrooxydans]|uniref:Alcohol dehydrogenase n=1 Tax=Acidihalobacter ferrooxydans TaxID=1765967 RepID=A0A1P8UKP0_9GAMM|nr:iron-containing alcohol dehydrogenase [Acidihalobacter ferrooxydans]APZ44400.1 alcohol dehydrogenase [Acidihalobacter ferrooxydans]